jgi:hypothetical protein
MKQISEALQNNEEDALNTGSALANNEVPKALKNFEAALLDD